MYWGPSTGESIIPFFWPRGIYKLGKYKNIYIWIAIGTKYDTLKLEDLQGKDPFQFWGYQKRLPGKVDLSIKSWKWQILVRKSLCANTIFRPWVSSWVCSWYGLYALPIPLDLCWPIWLPGTTCGLLGPWDVATVPEELNQFYLILLNVKVATDILLCYCKYVK